ncbi:FAD-binding oxidoreductase [Sphingorhabdus sp. 109]|nr:FAD-binding oxidoreductase [Sphingorhabdus sp. 109]
MDADDMKIAGNGESAAKDALIAKIAGVVDAGGLITGSDVALRPEDWQGQGSCQALAVIRPQNTGQLSAVMKLCHDAGQSVVAEGGLTGLVQGVRPTSGDIVISFERMADIESIDAVGRTMVVQAGVPLQKAQEAAEAADLLYAVDLGARGSATIGGTISTNAGGNQVLRYGMTRENILGLEAVLADGTIVSSMNSLLKNNSGYDLKQLFIGAEGTLGLVTRAVLRLRPRPVSENTALLAVGDFASVVTLFGSMGQKLAGSLTAFEVMWGDHFALLTTETGRHVPPVPAGQPYYVIVEATGADHRRDNEHFVEILGEALEDGLIVDSAISTSKSQRQAIWDIREDIEGLAGVLKPLVMFDVSMPIREMEQYISVLRKNIADQWGDTARIIVFGHLGDGNLHIFISPPADDQATHHLLEEIVYAPLQSIGGSISAEHGIGLEKRAWLHLCRSEDELALMHGLKKTLDPKGLLNPGKIF